jgi:Smg protein
MKENTLDVLFYLFDNYPEIDEEASDDRESLGQYLQGAGFMPGEIHRAFSWLESLGDEAEAVLTPSRSTTFRIFSSDEQRWMDTECRSYLLFLEQAGVINTESREQVIDRVLELEDHEFNLDKLKWVILMVLINRPEEDNSFFWTEGLTLDGTQPIYH